MPNFPLHDKCDCKIKSTNYLTVKSKATAECDIRKFTEYIFKDSTKSKGKNQIFYDLGYSVEDSKYLQQEFCRQALESYLTGNYILKNLDMRGQRLAIPIKLGNSIFYSGWMLYPEGRITNNTPFGGWVK